MEALEIFRIIAPEFRDIPDDPIIDADGHVETAGVSTYIELYKDQLSERRFGKTYQKALAYLTAHKMKMNGLGEQNGLGNISDSLRISSVSEGGTSVSFSTNPTSNTQVDAEYGLTSYGMEYLTLRRNCIVSILSAGEAY